MFLKNDLNIFSGVDTDIFCFFKKHFLRVLSKRLKTFHFLFFTHYLCLLDTRKCLATLIRTPLNSSSFSPLFTPLSCGSEISFRGCENNCGDDDRKKVR